MLNEERYIDECLDWLIDKIEALTESVNFPKPSEYAESVRYLPKSVTPLAGFYRYEVSPFLREIVDCLDISSPIREVNFMKGAQIGATVGIAENALAYIIGVLKSVPSMWLTADDELMKLRLDTYITPMIEQSGLANRIKSNEELNTRKTGKTDKKIEWMGGGYLIPAGAKSPNKGRSLSVQYLLEDEIDSFPLSTGKQGDTLKIFETRTNAFYQMRKILRLSTPLKQSTSRIYKKFLEGDQRYAFVPCKHCGEMQILRFSGTCQNTKRKYGLIYELDEGILQIDSVRYRCKFCFGDMTDADKKIMFNNGEWRPTAKPISPDIRSYHLSALYAPDVMYPWAAIVADYLKAWDIERNQVKDVEELQTFYNNNLGEPFKEEGERIRFEVVSSHRRIEYSYGQIPNVFASQYLDSHVYLLTCSADVHKDNLAVAVFGWTRGGRVLLIDYWRFYGNCENLEDLETWGKLQDLIDNKVYTADDGKEYRIVATNIDSQYLPATVYSFCSIWGSGVYPTQGRDMPTKGARMREFADFTTQLGTVGYGITVNLYKDRWSAALRKSWDKVSIQPPGYFNAPCDATDKQMKELTAETKREKKDNMTQKTVSFVWYRPSGVDNELWDLLIYSSFLFDLCMFDICMNILEMDHVNPDIFFQYIDDNPGLYFNAVN